MSQIKVHVRLPASVPEALLPRVENAVRGCPAWGTMLASPEAEMTVTRQ